MVWWCTIFTWLEFLSTLLEFLSTLLEFLSTLCWPGLVARPLSRFNLTVLLVQDELEAWEEGNGGCGHMRGSPAAFTHVVFWSHKGIDMSRKVEGLDFEHIHSSISAHHCYLGDCKPTLGWWRARNVCVSMYICTHVLYSMIHNLWELEPPKSLPPPTS